MSLETDIYTKLDGGKGGRERERESERDRLVNGGRAKGAEKASCGET